MPRTVLPLILLLAGLLWPITARGAEEIIEVGVLLPITGGYAPHGLTERRALTMAEEVINDRGGVKGRPLRFVVADTASNRATAVEEAGKLIERRRVAALMGGHSSAVAEGVGDLAVVRRFPFLITNASAQRLTDPATYTPSGQRLARLRRDLLTASAVERPLIKGEMALLSEKSFSEGRSLAPHFSLFRIAPPASDYDAGIASFLSQVAHPTSAVIIYERSLAGGARGAQFALTLKKMGIPLLASLPYDPAGADFRPLLHKVRQLAPDLLFAVSRGIDAPLLMRQAAQLRVEPKLIVGAGSGFDNEQFIERAASAGAYVMTSPLWSPLSPWRGSAEFADAFQRRFKSIPDYHAAEIYSAALVMADALERADGLSPRNIVESLRKTDMMTLFGPISFQDYDSTVQQNKHEPFLLQWIGGERRIVWSESLAEWPYVFPIDWAKVRSADKW